MNPTGPSQPTLNTSYNTEGNPAQHDPVEERTASENANLNSRSLVDKRECGDIPVPSSHGQEATPSSLAYGERDSSKDKGEAVSPPIQYFVHFVLRKL
jgi:hypothetical protein